MEMGALEHREQRKVRLNETLSSEMSKRPVVKAKPAHSPTIAPMMESFGIDCSPLIQHHPVRTRRQQVVCTRLTESTSWQLVSQRRMCGSSRWWKREREKFSFMTENRIQVAIVNREDPSVSKIINVCEARMGDKLDSEMRERKAKEVQELDEFEVKMKIVKSETRMTLGKKAWSKWVGNTKWSKQALVRVVWSQPSRRQYSVEMKNQVYQGMWMVEWLFWTSSASEIPSTRSFAECKFRGFESSAEQRCHFVLRGTTQGRIWSFAQESCPTQNGAPKNEGFPQPTREGDHQPTRVGETANQEGEGRPQPRKGEGDHQPTREGDDPTKKERGRPPRSTREEGPTKKAKGDAQPTGEGRPPNKRGNQDREVKSAQPQRERDRGEGERPLPPHRCFF